MSNPNTIREAVATLWIIGADEERGKVVRDAALAWADRLEDIRGPTMSDIRREDLRNVTWKANHRSIDVVTDAEVLRAVLYEDCASHAHGGPDDVNLACEHCGGSGRVLRDPPQAWTDWAEQGPLEWKFFVRAWLESDNE